MLVTSGDDLGVGFGECGGVAARPRPCGVARLVVSDIDDVGVVLPNKAVCVAGFSRAGLLVGICQSSRLLAEVELLEFLFRLAEVLVSVYGPLALTYLVPIPMGEGGGGCLQGVGRAYVLLLAV